jgi:hypothetical protein
MLGLLEFDFPHFHRWSFFMKHFIAAALVSIAIASPSAAQKLVDPTKVAPEYREAAEKRRAEQIRQQDCARKADTEKVIARERTAFLLQCLETVAGK